MSSERGDFKWKGDEVIWEPSEKGALINHPVLGPMPFDSPFANCIIGTDLAKMIDDRIRKKINEL